VKGTSACPQASSVDKPAPAQNIVQKNIPALRNHPQIPPTKRFFYPLPVPFREIGEGHRRAVCVRHRQHGALTAAAGSV
jgi:hypothetical protein